MRCRADPRPWRLTAAQRERFEELRALYRDFDVEAAARVKAIEATTNHDVKAVEYYLKERYDALGLPPAEKEFIHFGLTSQDVNNTAMPKAVQEALGGCLVPALEGVVDTLRALALEWDGIPMLARTHGQAATPTRLGKEVMVFVERLERQVAALGAMELSAKFGGASGGMNAHVVAYPAVDWRAVADGFVASLGLRRQRCTTQIEHYDGLAELFHCCSRIDTILLDLCRDFWQYVSLGYFAQAVVKDEVGSSAMPHKVNPIDFENAEGNLGLANALFAHLAAKLPVSRLQRDLTDSTVSRNFGVPFAHMLIALKSLRRGLGRISVNRAALHADLEANWAVVAEAVQTILRREGYPKPYEALKGFTRTGGGITQEGMRRFVQELEGVSQEVKAEIAAITPHNFTGLPL